MTMTKTQIDVRLPLTVDYTYHPPEEGAPSDLTVEEVHLGLSSIYDALPPEVLRDLEGRLLKIHEQENAECLTP